MATFKCKMCGGALEIGDELVAQCPYCGTQQTLPKLDDDRRVNLYDRANHFRRNSDFDKAMGIYEQILNEDNTDAEAYWSLVLCRYGITYVEDPATLKRIPTVNRTQYTSLFDDADYKSALQYADGHQRVLYEQEAATINRIQKGILAISEQEDPFDVFICYKETDQDGNRTPDSVVATELYHELTREGYKVFFSRITLEDKLGVAYEPYIFAALNSAKVMVVLGTKPEHFNAVWVKNEWSRYLALSKAGGKTLIPAYRDMDPYDLPDEFSHLQALDMSKLGFMQDLLRGINKIIQGSAPVATTVHKTEVVMAGNTNIAPLLKRAFMFLEDGEWESADEYAEKVLDIEPECGEAYLAKLMASIKVRIRAKLKDCAESFENNGNYQKVMRYGDVQLKEELQGAIDFIRERNARAKYEDAVAVMNQAASEEDYRSAAIKLRNCGDYADAPQLLEECRRKAEEQGRKEAYEEAFAAMDCAEDKEDYLIAAEMFRKCGDYADASRLAEVCFCQSKEWGRKVIYEEAESALRVGTVSYLKMASEMFASLGEWKDSAQRAEECQHQYEELSRQKAKKRNRILIIGAVVTGLLCILFFVNMYVIIPNNAYSKGDYRTYIETYGIGNFVIPDGTEEIKDKAFRDCDSLKKVTIPDSVTTIGYEAFANCDSLTAVTIPDGVTTIGMSAFRNCDSLTEVIIPGSVESIEYDAFYDCDSLEKVTILDGVTAIDGSAFYGCYSLTEVIIPDSVTSIGLVAFNWCPNLKTIYYGGTEGQWRNIHGDEEIPSGVTVICAK